MPALWSYFITGPKGNVGVNLLTPSSVVTWLHFLHGYTNAIKGKKHCGLNHREWILEVQTSPSFYKTAMHTYYSAHWHCPNESNLAGGPQFVVRICVVCVFGSCPMTLGLPMTNDIGLWISDLAGLHITPQILYWIVLFQYQI